MAGEITIRLDASRYQIPTESDIRRGKSYILQREAMAQALEAQVDIILGDLAEAVVTLCYQYGVDPRTFTLTESYNPELMKKVQALMEQAEDEILSLIDDYATRCTKDRDRMGLLALWIATLGSRNRNLAQVTHDHMYKFIRDLEAAIAALRYARTELARAVTVVRTYLHQIYNIPEVRMAFTRSTVFSAIYIRSRGINPGGVGLSNNGSTNLTNMARLTLQMAWMMSQMMDFREAGAVGYYQLRGSDYKCEVCDEAEGFHLGIPDSTEWPHANCRCYRIPVFVNGETGAPIFSE